ncbi:PQQ-dependent sugar dehydrogenase [Flavisolibacter ginsenosidimutans]|uniref:Sorbosone dehydrogenase family protein n=1 Tax=Flavisolibacter ginsenosidimutans TaxID=661481 RepID=A0A5B8UJM0_9BACT|nr:sorbosone dehydrogenase family protein [Flavisolibacter ginsenosidimutans]QEC56901.1 sorbosone dehydrogenase family protein [Flavisolibacter ginsenosidimutans]
MQRNPLLFSFWLLLLVQNFISCKDKEPVAPQASTAPGNDLFSKYHLDKIKLPAGFKISVFAEVPGARSLTLSPAGTLFVGTQGSKVYAVVDKDKNGVADSVYTVASGLTTPNGVAFKDGALYVAEISRILRFDNIEASLQNPPAYKVVYDKFPTDGAHGWKFIAFGPDDKLYVPVGAPCNICEPDSMHACIIRMNKDGSGLEVFAKGIRNSVGFDWNPQTAALWFTDNGRDNLGDDRPNDELNTAPQKGLHFGYPYCHQGNILDPEFGQGKNCDDYTKPAFLLGPHVAALGMRFYTGNLFPADYNGGIFIAQHGSWNRSTPIGYQVAFVKMENGKAVSATPFASGWLNGSDVLGRPVDVQMMQDGSLLVSDDKQGVVYRISYGK